MGQAYYLPPVTVHPFVAKNDSSKPWWFEDFNIRAVHAAGITGVSVRVGVCDTGIDAKHAKSGGFKKRIVSGRAFVGSKEDYFDSDGHGTHVAGILAGKGSITGIAPDAELIVSRVLGKDGIGTLRSVLNGIRYCFDEGCQVICCSLGTDEPDDKILKLIDECVSHGVVFVCAAGNDSGLDDSVDWPGAHKNTIAVSALDSNRDFAPFCSRGKQVDFCAPGAQIISYGLNGTRRMLSGSSMATPWVAGCVALLKQLQPDLSFSQAVAKLREAALDLGDPGKDDSHGYGLVLPEKLFLV